MFSTLKNVGYWFLMTLLGVYVLNPGAGVFELIPDNLPVVGNLDEAAAVGLLIALFKSWRTWRSNGKDSAAPTKPDSGRLD